MQQMSPRIILGIGATLIVVLVAVVVFQDVQRRDMQAQLQAITDAESQTEEAKLDDDATAIDILARVRRHITIPEGIQPTVAEIIDIDALRAKNPFYDQAQKGDYLIVTTDRAILYSPSRDVILDFVPIQLERNIPDPAAAE